MFSKIHNAVRRFVVASAIGGPVLLSVPVGGCNPLVEFIKQATELAGVTQDWPSENPGELTTIDYPTYTPGYSSTGFPAATLYDPTSTIESVYTYRQEVYENVNNAWGEYMRQ